MNQSEKIEFRTQSTKIEDEVDAWVQYVDALFQYQKQLAEAKKELQHKAIKRLTSLPANGVLDLAKEAALPISAYGRPAANKKPLLQAP